MKENKNTKRILIVDDEPDIVVYLTAILEDNGYDVISAQSAEDALHIAVAAVNGVDYLLTWNCKHLANAVHYHRVEQIVENAGYACPIICTPEELMEE